MKSKIAKKKKLLLQIGVVIVFMFAMAGLIITFTVYYNTINLYLSTKNEPMANDIEAIRNVLEYDNGIDWLFDYITIENPDFIDQYDEIKEKLSYEIEDNNYTTYFYQVLDEISKGFEDEDRVISVGNLGRKDLEKLTDEQKLIYAVYFLYGNEGVFSYSKKAGGYTNCCILVTKYTDKDYIIYGNEKLLETIDKGSYFDSYSFKHYDGNKSVNFFKLNKSDGYDLYVGVCPVRCYETGETIGYLYVSYEYNSYKAGAMQVVKDVLRVILITLVISLVVILLVTYQLSIYPLSKVTESVRRYMEKKQSKKLLSDLSLIRHKNEFGVLADDISELVVEMERFSEDNIRMVKEKEKATSELEVAREIQMRMVPNVFPPFPDKKEFDIYGYMCPAKEVGGDFYDFFLIDDNHLGLVIADVSGKGVPAAIFMMMCKNVIQNFALLGLKPDEVLKRSNLKILENNPHDMFVSVWFAVYEIDSGYVIASNGGHELPVIRGKEGDYAFLNDEPHGVVLGAFKDSEYVNYEFYVEEGGTLFVYTDGVTEATDKNEELYGMDRIIDTLNKSSVSEPEKILKTINDSVNEFVGDAPQFDDITMLCINNNKSI